MAGSLQPRVKTWVSTEDVVYSDLNAEFDNVLTAMQPLLMDDYSTDVTQMQVTTDPGEVGAESKATTLAGELARLRFIVKEITGEGQWYESPVASLVGLSNALGGGLSPNRLVSGRMLSTSAQPAFLVPNGAARTVKVDGTPTAFVYYVNGISYSIITDTTLTNLTLAPSSNNTALINDALATGGQDWTKHAGEDGTEIIVDTMGTEITALIGKFAAFKLAGAATEYFIAYVASATSLTKARRGYFFDSTDAPVKRTTYTNNDTITLMKLSWIFAKTDLTLEVCYTNPTWGKDEPSSPAVGDFWYDTDNSTWKKYSGTAFAASGSTLVGTCIQDGTNTIGARSYEFFGNYTDTNTFEIIAESNTQVKTRFPGAQANVWGTGVKYEHNLITWDMTLDLETGVTEAASTFYYFYLTEEGDKVISNIKPYDRDDLLGQYHPHNSWRCVGRAFNNGSSNLEQVESYFRGSKQDARLIRSVIATDVMIPKDRDIELSGATFTTYLPPAALMKGVTLIFHHAGTSLSMVYTLDGYASETIGGSTTVALYTNGETLSIRPNVAGTGWIIVSHYAQTAWVSDGVTVIGATTTAPTKGSVQTVDRLMWMRDGQNLIGRIEFRQTNATGSAAGTGDYLFKAVPTGAAIDTSFVTVYTTVEGSGGWTANSSVGLGFNSMTSEGTMNVIPYDTTQVRFSENGDATSGFISAGHKNLTNTNMAYCVTYSVPISGWLP